MSACVELYSQLCVVYLCLSTGNTFPALLLLRPRVLEMWQPLVGLADLALPPGVSSKDIHPE